MTYAELKSALSRLPPQVMESGEGATDQEINNAELRIGALPDEYRSFLADFGWLAVRQYEIYGLGSDVPRHLNLVHMTLDERSNYGLPSNLVPIMNNGAGDLYCFDGAKPEIIFWDHYASPLKGTSMVDPSFSAWLLNLLETE
jgi:hypothetical protein